MKIPRFRVVAVAVAAVAVGIAASLASCGTTPPNVVTHSLQQSQKVDVVCYEVNDPTTLLPIVPTLADKSLCAPVAANVTAQTLPYHLFALVTQPTLGALAVVDLTVGTVVDVDRTTPGIDFIPVGANPTDVAVSGDMQKTFVSSADPNKLAIYALDNGCTAADGGAGSCLLGDLSGLGLGTPLRLTDLSACALPQAPVALALVSAAAADGGAGDGGGASSGYAVVAVLRASTLGPAAVITLDPTVLSAAPHGALPACSTIGAVLGGRSSPVRRPRSPPPRKCRGPTAFNTMRPRAALRRCRVASAEGAPEPAWRTRARGPMTPTRMPGRTPVTRGQGKRGSRACRSGRLIRRRSPCAAICRSSTSRTTRSRSFTSSTCMTQRDRPSSHRSLRRARSMPPMSCRSERSPSARRPTITTRISTPSTPSKGR